MRRYLLLIPALFLGLVILGQPVGAQSGDGLLTQGERSLIEPDRQFSDPALAERYEALLWELRCPQCENQSIGDSNAPVSAAMRDRVATLLRDGRSNDEIVAHMIERWGQQVTFRPGLGAHTVWILAVAVLAVGALFGVIIGLRRQHSGLGGAGPLTDDEVQELEALRRGDADVAGPTPDRPPDNEGATRP